MILDFTPCCYERGYQGRRIRCSIDKKASNIEGGTLTDIVTVSEHGVLTNTFHEKVGVALLGLNASAKSRVDKIASALFYTYVWGWYTGFIEMPYYSIQGLLSHPPVSLTGHAMEAAQSIQENQDALQRYRLLSSLFADESEPEFKTKNFSFLTPQEALDVYISSYDERFNGYFGRALGGFLKMVKGGQQ